MHINTDAYKCTHLDSDAKTNPTVSNSTVLVIVCLGLWTDSTVCRESAWDLEEFGPSRKILRTVNISRPTVIPTGRNAQHNSLHTLL